MWFWAMKLRKDIGTIFNLIPTDNSSHVLTAIVNAMPIKAALLHDQVGSGNMARSIVSN